MLTYPWKCTVLHCTHLGNTWKPLVRMTRHFDYCPSSSEGDNQSVRSSAPVVSRCFPGGYNVKLYISRGRLAWWLLTFLHSASFSGAKHSCDQFSSCSLRNRRRPQCHTIIEWLESSADIKGTYHRGEHITTGTISTIIAAWWVYVKHSQASFLRNLMLCKNFQIRGICIEHRIQ